MAAWRDNIVLQKLVSNQTERELEQSLKSTEELPTNNLLGKGQMK